MKYERLGTWLILKFDGEDSVKRVVGEHFLKKITYKHLRNRQEINEDLIIKNDELWFDIFHDEEIDFVPEDDYLDVVYEDDFLLVVNKPSGMLVHPDEKTKTKTLANLVAGYYQQHGIKTTVRPLHRLDVDTSGLIIFSKVSALQGYFDSLIADKMIVRDYYAFVNGYYARGQKFVIDAPIGRDRHNAKKYRVSDTGKEAVTFGRCIISNRRMNISMLSLRLETGRTHQIRVHMAYHRHPIIGDRLYNENKSDIRLTLMAYHLNIKSLFHPNGLDIEIPLDSELDNYFKEMRIDEKY
ncbi:MAG: RluA family pseudouridine synthase [Erysipelotrichaceae bacterium]|nr:RluA family pseudouridine synthase [Erysipelotrichaceae bacterium]